jgi:hypothetical protein
MASLTKRDLVVALEELLPPLDPTKVTLRTVMADLAGHFNVDLTELKANHKEELKETISDMLHLCEGGEDKENEPQSGEADEDEEDEEEVAPKKRPSKRSRGHRIQESEDEDADDVDESDDDDASGDSDDDERPPKRRKKVREPNGRALMVEITDLSNVQ